MKKPLNIKKFLLPNIPYVFIALFATKLGQAWRLAPGMDFSGKALHLMEGFAAAFQSALPCKAAGKPQAIIAKTVKGKGVSFMENQVGWHGKAPDAEQTKQALAELESEVDGD